MNDNDNFIDEIFCIGDQLRSSYWACELDGIGLAWVVGPVEKDCQYEIRARRE